MIRKLAPGAEPVAPEGLGAPRPENGAAERRTGALALLAAVATRLLSLFPSASRRSAGTQRYNPRPTSPQTAKGADVKRGRGAARTATQSTSTTWRPKRRRPPGATSSTRSSRSAGSLSPRPRRPMCAESKPESLTIAGAALASASGVTCSARPGEHAPDDRRERGRRNCEPVFENYRGSSRKLCEGPRFRSRNRRAP